MKHFFKVALVIVTSSILLLAGCQKEQSVSEEEIQSQSPLHELSGKRVQGEELFKDNKDLDIFLRTQFNTNNQLSTEDVVSNNYGFTIQTDEIQVISSDRYTSYTFKVMRGTYDIFTAENYILTIYDDGNYNQLLATYPLEEVNGKLSHNMQTATVQNIVDESLLYAEIIYPCTGTMQELVSWDASAGNCVAFNCMEPSGDGTHGPGESCSAQGGDRAFEVCSGAWVVTGCIQIGGGSTGGDGPFGSPSGGGNNPDDTDPHDDEEIPLVPVIPAWQQIVNCMNANSFSSLNGTGLPPLLDTEIQWLQDALRIVTIPMLNYLETNSCDAESANFNDVAIDEFMDGSEVEYDEKIILHSSLNDYPCQKKIIIESYSLRTPILDLFRAIFESDSAIDVNGGTLNVTYSAENTGTILQTAYTNGNPSDNDFSFKTVFNTESLSNSTDLKIVGATIHEAIHAVLLHFYYSGGLVVTPANADPTYKELVEAFIEKRQQIGDTNISQHTYMVGLKDLIANGMYTWATTKSDYTDAQFTEFDSNPNDQVNDGLLQYCKMLAWSGLRDTGFFDELYPPFPLNPARIVIENVIAQEISSGNEAKGTKASTLTCND
ncbi:hypothetical protein IMCC3317_34560 [Kordia antarctica]|uniref:Uncharacterized protein n=2 Tax=Kordia antarctica TaxID=1218801 RepID=A0A7L4ZN29_9FLAO|nr:hypothetical protein IMCC3317_34560 [Kordia antarctica]